MRVGFQLKFFGVVEAIDFVGFGDVEERFEQDWTALKGHR